MKHIKEFFLTILFCAVFAFFLTIIYIKLPPFYINSFNFAIVFDLEKSDQNFNYNGFYQSQLNNEVVKNLALFSAGSDFKQKLSKELNTNLIYMLAKTNGTSIVTLQLVTLKELDKNKVSQIIKKDLESTLALTIPKGMEYKINSLLEFNQTYINFVSPNKFFTITFSITLIFYSLFLLLKGFLYGK